MSRVLLRPFQNSQILNNSKTRSNIEFQIDGLRNSTNTMLLILIFITKKLELCRKEAKLIKLKRFSRDRRSKKLFRIRFSATTQLSWKTMTSRQVRLRSMRISYPRLRRRELYLKTDTTLCQQMLPSKELMSFLLKNPLKMPERVYNSRHSMIGLKLPICSMMAWFLRSFFRSLILLSTITWSCVSRKSLMRSIGQTIWGTCT